MTQPQLFSMPPQRVRNRGRIPCDSAPGFRSFVEPITPAPVVLPTPVKEARPKPRFGADGRPQELSDLERLVFPKWLDHDSATGGPSYLGYVMVELVIGLPLIFLVLAIAVVW